MIKTSSMFLLALGLGAALRADAFPALPASGAAAPYPAAAYAAPRPQAYAQPVPRPTPAPRVLEHRWGFGLDNIPGATGNPVSGTLVSAPNAVAVRWWATEKIGLDLLAALDATSLQTGTSGSSGGAGASSPGTAASGFGVGLGVKYNLTRPSRDLLTQLVARVTTASSTQSDATGLLKLNTSTMGFFIGAGFEAFVPGWDWLSLEGNAGLSLRTQTIKPDSGSAAGVASASASQTTSSMGLGGSGFSPINVAFHVYF